jgi:hypothetical protein
MRIIQEALDRVLVGRETVHRNLVVWPLLRPADAPDDAPSYLPLPDALARGAVRITEVSEGGSVPQLTVVNDADAPVLLLDGEELVGAKQNRVVNLTILAPAKRSLPIPVSCVERGRWHWASRHFAEAPRTMFAEGRARKMRDVSRSMRESGSRAADQGAVWDAVAARASSLRVASPTGAMGDVFDGHRASLEAYVGAFRAAPRQAGAVFAIGGRVAGLELFDSARTWRTYMPKLVRSYALDAIDALSRREASPPARAPGRGLKELLAAVRRAEGAAYPAVGVGEDVRFEAAGVAGGALVADRAVVHLSALAG